VTDVHRHKHRFGHQPVVGAARINPPTAGHHDPADLLIVVDIVSARREAEHVDRVIMPPHQPIGAEVGYLFTTMAGDVVRNNYVQPAPGFPVLLPWRDLFVTKPG
jgi:hypothetical protein